MAKVKTSVLFKQYNQQQNFLLPPSPDELIEKTHLVRVVNEVVEAMEITALINQYEGGGTTAYHPRMLLKVLLYGYCMKIYTGRKIAKAVRQDIHFMWLSAMNRPDFRTINNFRSGKAKEVIEELFQSLLLFLMDHDYIKMENYFCDGSTFAADANKHKMVWKKNADRYKKATEENCRKLFKQIEELNHSEDKMYADSDLEEAGSKPINKEAIAGQVEKLNQVIETVASKKEKRKAAAIKKQLQKNGNKIRSYEQQSLAAGNRSGYNRTDKDATAMRMKNGETLPAYNILAGSENQFIVGCSVHQNTNDGVCFKQHLEQLEKHSEKLPDAIMADSIFGTEENYELLQAKDIENYLKFPSFHKEHKKSYQNNPFLKDNFHYDALTDTYTCPTGQLLILKQTTQQTHKRTGYKSTIKVYGCENCTGCPFYSQCCKSENEKNRIIKVNEKLENYKQQARENLKSEKGIRLRKQRGVEIESCFGDIKHNMGFRRFHVRGLQKVKAEWTIVAMAHNLRKIHLQKLENAA
ncbi:MAG: IS1182 family transposase [Flavisolibacter sp.]|nr:IS1182 family transposase [Flavisolibacter sp.]